MPSQQQTLEQKRAAQAWADVSAVKPQSFKGKYGGLVRKLPAHITGNGLGQTLAFLRAKSAAKPGKPPSAENQAHNAAYQHLSHWVMQQLNPTVQQPNDTLLPWLLGQTSEVYRQATAESLAYLVWLKRFAEAELPEEE